MLGFQVFDSTTFQLFLEKKLLSMLILMFE